MGTVASQEKEEDEAAMLESRKYALMAETLGAAERISHVLLLSLLECLDHSMHIFHAYIPCIPCLLASSLWAMSTYIHGFHTHRSSCLLSFSTARIENLLGFGRLKLRRTLLARLAENNCDREVY